MTIVVDTDSQMIPSANVSIGPSNDGAILRDMFENGLIPSCQVLLADSGYDCRGNEEIAVFRPIRRGGCYKSEDRINLFFRWLFYPIIGIYGKRWKVETIFSVIKRRFGDRIKSHPNYSKFIESSLIPTAYNIWRFLFPLTLLSLLPLLNPLFSTEQQTSIKITKKPVKLFQIKLSVIFHLVVKINCIGSCNE